MNSEAPKEVGDEAIDLLLAPGLDGTGKLFVWLTQALPSAHFTPRVLAYPDALRSMDDHTAHLREACQQERPFILLAESFSGPVTQELLRQTPLPHCRGLIFLASFATSPWPRMLRLVCHRAARPLLNMPPPPVWAIKAVMLGQNPQQPPQAIPLTRAINAQQPPETLLARLQILRDLHHPPAPLPANLPPTLIIQAKADRLVPAKATQHLRDLLPRARHTTLPGAHLLAQHSPQAVADTITRWWQDQETSLAQNKQS